MYSQCPDCLTRFRVTAAHLRAAGGTVRCGRCGAAFDALATLTDTLQGPEAATLALAAAATPAIADEAAPAGAYHFSADDLERVFIDARDWHRQFGKSAPIVEPDEVAEAARVTEAATRVDDTRTQIIPAADDFEPPAWAEDIAEGDLESTQPLPVLRNVPEAALFEDADEPPAGTAALETGAVEPSAADIAADFGEDVLNDGYVPARVEPEVEAIFETTPEPLAEVDVALEPTPVDGEPEPLDVELDLAAVDIEFEPGADGTPATLDVELEPTLVDDEPEPVDVELEPATTAVVDPLLTEPPSLEETALVASFELPDERVPWPPYEPEPITPSGLEPPLTTAVTPAALEVPAVVAYEAAAQIEPEVWIAPGLVTGTVPQAPIEPPTELPADSPAVVAAVARGSAADLPLGSGRRRATLEAEAELEELADDSDDTRGPFPWGWALGCLLLLLTLGAQFVHQYRNTLLRDRRVGPLVAEAYARLGRPLAPLADPTMFELRQHGNVADSPQGTLHVRASITNEAAFAQAPPLLRVQLEDRFGNEVSVRDFTPADYQPEGATVPATLAAGARIPVDLMLLDPGGDAVGFQLRTCVPDDGAPGRLRCGP